MTCLVDLSGTARCLALAIRTTCLAMVPPPFLCRVPVSHCISVDLHSVFLSTLFLHRLSLLRRPKVNLVSMVDSGCGGGSIRRFAVGIAVLRNVLFPTAWYDLSRISPLFICSLCTSPCSFLSPVTFRRCCAFIGGW